MQGIDYHYWSMERKSGVQFKDCRKCGHTHTLEYHFDVISGDIEECEECGAKHEIFA